MPVSYVDSLKRTRMNAVNTEVNADSPTNPGYIDIGTTGGFTGANLLVRIPLEADAFAPGASTTGGNTFIRMAVPTGTDGLSGVATGSGEAYYARICDGTNRPVVEGLRVGTGITGGVEIALSALSISAGQTVTLTSGVITHAP